MITRRFQKHWYGLLAFAFLSAASCATSGVSPSSPEWLESPAIYEVFTRDFSQQGTFNGVTAGLDRIKATGTNVIWLMPIHPIGVLNRKPPLGSSYSVTDYRAINPDYGTEADFRRLVDEVHRRGMKIIIDWVPNHTAWDHVWVQRHPERYTMVDGKLSVPRDNDGKPTDWTDVADLNYNDPGLRRAMVEAMKYWLDRYDIDGFRVDVAGFVPDDFWREALPALRAGRKPILLLAEWADPRMHELGFDLSYGWDGYGKLKAVWKGEPAASFVEREMQERLPHHGRRLRFTTNHDETAWDQPPPVRFGGIAGARAAFIAMALLPGVPMLYNGQEVESPQKLGLFVKEPIQWEQPDENNARAFYQRVIELATSHPAFTGGELQHVVTDAPRDVIAYARGDVVVLVNTRPRSMEVTVHGRTPHRARDLIYGWVQSGDKVKLSAYGTAVLDPRRR